MANIKFGLDLRTSKHGRFLVRMRISANRTNAYLNTGCYLYPEELTADITRPVDPKAPNAKEVARILDSFAGRFRSVAYTLELEHRDRSVHAKEIRDLILGGSHTDNEFFDTWLQDYGRRHERERSRKSYEYTCNLFNVYASTHAYGRARLCDINYSFVRDFDRWLETDKRLSISTRGIHQRNMRAAWNDARNRGYVEGRSPWSDFKIRRKAQHEIEYLSRQQMQQLMAALPIGTKATRAQHLAFVSLCLCGANLADIWNMPKLTGDRIEYVRMKIARHEPLPVKIHVEPELESLVLEHAGKNHLFAFSEGEGSFSTFQRNLNTGFQQLSAQLGFRVNLAIIRHTWATLAEELDVPRVVIDKSLGHVATDVTGRYYAGYNWDKTAQANRKVLDYVLGIS